MDAKEGKDWELCLIHHPPTLFLMKRQPRPHPHPSCHPFFYFSPCLEIFQNAEERQQGWGVIDNPWGLLLCFPDVLAISVLHTVYLKNHIQGWSDDSVGKSLSMQVGRSASGPPARTQRSQACRQEDPPAYWPASRANW